MNRIERRISRTNGVRPGAPVCNPGQPAQNNVGMLGGSSQLYQTVRERQERQIQARQVNGLAMLQAQGDRISRLEQKIQQLEQMNIMNISRTDAELKNKDKTIDLMNQDFRTTMKELRNHIKELQTKISHLNGDIPIVKAVKKQIQVANNPSAPPPVSSIKTSVNQANITLEISET